MADVEIIHIEENLLLSAGASHTFPKQLIYPGGKRIRGSVYSDVASATDGLEIRQSIDGTNFDTIDKDTVNADESKTFEFKLVDNWVQVKFTNGGTAQGVFRITAKIDDQI